MVPVYTSSQLKEKTIDLKWWIFYFYNIIDIIETVCFQ